MHTSKSFNNSTTTSSYYNTTSNSENGTKITEEGEGKTRKHSLINHKTAVFVVIMTDPVGAISEIRDLDKIRRYYSNK
jgi:hypothetical protein